MTEQAGGTGPSALDGPRPFRRRMLVNTAAVGASNGWAMVVALVSLPLVLRGLGATAFGVWALLQTFSAVSGWFSLLDLGLGTAATREVAAHHAVDDHEELGAAVGSTVGLHAALGIASGLLLASAGPVLLPHVFNAPERLHHELRVAAVAFGAQVAFDLFCGGCQAVLDGYQRVDLSRVVDIVRRTLVAVAISATALKTHRLGAVAINSAAATAAGAVIGAWMLVRVTAGCRPRMRRSTIGMLFSYGRKVAVLRPLGVLHRTVDRFVVGAILGPAAVSLVEVATQLQNGADAVLSASSYAVVPGAARLQALGDRHKLAELAETGTRYVLLATWPVAALTAVLAGPAIDLWVGHRYHEAAGLVPLALAALALAAPVQVGSNLLLGTGRATDILRVAFVAIVVNVALSIGLVHVVGIAGAFQATIVAAAIAFPLLLGAALADLEVGAAEFCRVAMVPALAAPALAAAGAGIAVLLPLAALPTLLIGGVLGVAGAAVGALRFGLTTDEVHRLRARLPGG